MHLILPGVGDDGRVTAVRDLEAATATPAAALELTTRCNLRCVYCLKAQPRERYRDDADAHDSRHMVFGADLSTEVLETIVAGLVERRVEEITINGHGESTLYRGWETVAARLIDAGLRVIMTSNFARRFNDAEIAVLARFHRLYVSLDSSDAERLARYRPRLDLAVVLDNLRRLRAVAAAEDVAGPGVRFCAGLYAEVIPTVEGLARLAVDLGVEHVIFWNQYVYPEVEGVEAVTPLASLGETDKLWAAARIRQALGILDAAKITYEFDADWLATLERTAAAEPPPALAPGLTRSCTEPWVFTLFQANGSVAPCRVRVNAALPLKPGQPLAEVVEGDGFRALRRALLTGDLDATCAACHHKPLVPREQLLARVVDAALLHRRARGDDDCLADAEMARIAGAVQIAHCSPESSGFADRIRLVAAGGRGAAVWFRKLDLGRWRRVAVAVAADAENPAPVRVSLACNDVASGAPIEVAEACLAPGGEQAIAVDLPEGAAKLDLVLRCRAEAPTARPCRVRASYPLLTTDGEEGLVPSGPVVAASLGGGLR